MKKLKIVKQTITGRLALLAALVLLGTSILGCGGNSGAAAQDGGGDVQSSSDAASGDAAGADDQSGASGSDASGQEGGAASDGELLTGKHHVEIDVQDYGVISVELDADVAPITVTNFVSLAESGFYDGLTFHRIISGFMIQGGDPTGTGMGGSDTTIKGEFSENGVENNLSHTRGVISMARSQAYDSASSQFFIVHQDSTYLDGQYAAFGTVTDGMDVVDAIGEDTPVEDNNGSVAAENQPVITSIKVID